MPREASERDAMTGPGSVREPLARWVITGELRLESACHLGNGESGNTVDMPLSLDRVSDQPLLTGSSLVGGLRSHVNDRWLGFETAEERAAAAVALFGGNRGDEDGGQSPLIVFDAIGSLPEKATSEIRDGVSLDAGRGTAAEHLKFDLEVLPRGTIFPLRFELLIDRGQEETSLVQMQAVALSGLERGDIRLGARRSRGLGACRVGYWRARRFDLTSKAGWLAWLDSDYLRPTRGISPGREIEPVLAALARGLRTTDVPDNRSLVRIEAELQVQGGLLVRSPGLTASAADATHLHSGGRPVLPGTCVAGALRARALRIARLVRAAQQDGDRWVERLFGPRRQSRPADRNVRPTASRLRVSEQILEDGKQLRPSRIRVDRFTGGVVEGFLFDEEPNCGSKTVLELELRSPRPGEIGLLLLVLKDLLTGDLPLGGTSSVGRGVVTGRARVHLPGQAEPTRFDPVSTADAATVRTLNQAVEEFRTAAVLPEAQ
jgi:CRISPR/Cas system CSM-associated protein Csm3 (group 7 of RAMP superfamily)